MSRIKYLLIICFLLLARVSFCQTKIDISGVVKDASGVPVAGGLVAIENSACGTYTQKDGSYTLHTTPGTHTLIVSMIGFNTIHQKINGEVSRKIDFRIIENSHTLNAVEVYGTCNSSKLKHSEYAVSNLDVSSISGSVTNLNTYINKTSGIHIREEGGIGSDFNLSINGLSGNAIKYFMDGVPLSAIDENILNNVPINLVDRIEVYKGVVPADFGQDALGGAINIITRQDKKNYLDASATVGSFSTYKFDITAQKFYPQSGFTIKPTFGWSSSKNDYNMKDVEVWNDDLESYQRVDKKRFHDGYRSLFSKIELGFIERKWADRALISASITSENKEIQTGQKQTIVIGNATREKSSLNISANYQKKHFLLPKLKNMLFVSFTKNNTMLTDTTLRRYAWDGTWAESSYSEVTGRGKSIRRYQIPQLIIRNNLDYSFYDNASLHFNYVLNSIENRRSDDYDLQFTPTNDRLDKHILGLSYNFRAINNQLNASIFLKDYIIHTLLKQYDMYWLTGINDVKPSTTQNYVGYGFGARYAFNRFHSFKISYEKSVRLPEAKEFLGNGITIYPNFKLKPETSNNYNIGILGTFYPHEYSKLSYEGGLFIRQVSDYIFLIILADREMQYKNVSSATIRGLEGELSYSYNNKLAITANATYLNEVNKTKVKEDGTTNITYNNRIPNKPWAFGNVDFKWNIPSPFHFKHSRLSMCYSVQYIHWFYLTWEAFGSKNSKEIIPTQFSNDISATWSFGKDKYTIMLGCSNIFDQKLYDNYMLQKPGRAFVSKFRIFIN